MDFDTLKIHLAIEIEQVITGNTVRLSIRQDRGDVVEESRADALSQLIGMHVHSA